MAMLKYDYSTKNFHRFGGKGDRVNEVYIMRSAMPAPVAEVQVDVTWDVTQQPVLERVKPVKAHNG
jgi:hypothetical protein